MMNCCVCIDVSFDDEPHFDKTTWLASVHAVR